MIGKEEAMPVEAPSSNRGWRFYAFGAVILLALIFVFQNTDKTNINFLFAQTEMPLFFALLVAVLLGVLIGWLTPKVRGGGKSED